MEKINIAEMLLNCLEGMELDCVMYDNIVFAGIQNGIYPIKIKIKNTEKYLYLTKYGCSSENENAKCVIFPKGKNTWKGFTPPCQFKDGDIIHICNEHNDATYVAILKQIEKEGEIIIYCFYNFEHDYIATHDFLGNNYNTRFATEEEKEKLFQAIKDNGYRWDEERKTLEKLPIFKVGDRIRHKKNKDDVFKIDGIDMDNNLYCCGRNYIQISYQDKYELVPDKFDINTLIPFESKVLVRNKEHYKWEGAVFGRYDNNTFFVIGGADWKYCIPYEGNEHLHGTANSCDDYFKIWEK